MRPFRLVAELTNPGRNGEKFAVLSVDPSKRHPDGGCWATVLSVHHSQEQADEAAK